MSARLQQETLQFLVRAMEEKNRELQTTLGRFRQQKLEMELRMLRNRFQIECGCPAPDFRLAA